MTRNDFISTFPTEKGEDRKAGNLKDDMLGVSAPVEEEGAVAPTFDSKATC